MNGELVRKLLKSELARRVKDNRQYSLRAFAKALDMDASTLAKLMSGQRAIGIRSQTRLLNQLGVSSEASLSELSTLPVHLSASISDWYMVAILEQLNVSGFRATGSSLSKVLGIKKVLVEDGLERLKQIGMISISPAGIVKDLTRGSSTDLAHENTTDVKKRLQRQFLEKAIESLDRDQLQDRDHTTLTFAIDNEHLPEIKSLIKNFRRDIARVCGLTSKTNQVYNVSVALYPLTKNLKDA